MHAGDGNLLGAVSTRFAKARDEFGSFYQLRMDGEDRIANRQVVKLLVTPRDAYRLGHSLFLDKETGLLLKSPSPRQGDSL